MLPNCFDIFGDKKLSAAEFISELYPITENSTYDKKTSKIILDRISAILSLVVDAIEAFQRKELTKFDAHVGETACHIRALIVIRLYIQLYERINFNAELTQVSKLILHIKELSEKISSVNENNIFLLKYITSKQLFFSALVPFLSQCYILTFCTNRDEVGFPESLNKQLFSDATGLSSHAVNTVFSNYQKNISKLSISLMLQFSKLEFDNELQDELFKSKKIGNGRRHMMPLFSTMKIIEHFLVTESIVIVFRVRFGGGREYIIPIKFFDEKCVLVGAEEISSPCFVIYGVSSNQAKTPNEYFNIINPFLKDLFLIDMNTAAHKQYVDNSDFELPQKYVNVYNRAKLMASLLGCTLNDNSLFTIKHIYADMFTNILKKSKQPNTELAYSDQYFPISILQ